MEDKELLEWIHERLEHRFAENPNSDYMIKLRELINNYCASESVPEQEIKLESLKVLRLEPDDIIVRKVWKGFSPDDLHFMEQEMEDLNIKNKVIYLHHDEDISAIRPVKDKE